MPLLGLLLKAFALYTVAILRVLKNRLSINRSVHAPFATRASYVASGIFILFGTTLTSAQPINNRGCAPVSERTADVGCWIIAREQVGELPKSKVFWHIDNYRNRAEAEAA